MDYIPAQCARSLGPANQMVNLLIQTLLSSYCELSDPGWPKDCGETATDQSYYDFIVVGAGTAGSVIAGRLSENPNWTVLLLEAGDDPPIESEIPSLFCTLSKTKYNWEYEAHAEHGCLITNKTCTWTRGKMLGGSSAHNGHVYDRGNKFNFDYWSTLGNKGWDYKSTLKYMRRWEGNKNPYIANYDKSYYHNQTGPLNVSLFYRNPNSRIFLNAAKETCNEHILDINADKTLGYFYHQGFVYDGVRQSAAKAYLIPANNRPNLCVVKNAVAYKVLFDKDNKVIGVEYDYNGSNFTAYGNKEIILSAGTIESTKLLLLSGIGPKSQLDQFNISTISDLPVGENLIDHVGVVLYMKFEGKRPSSTQLLDDTYDYFIYRTGPFASRGELSGHENSKNNTQYKNSDLQVSYGYFDRNSTTLPFYKSAIKDEKIFQINQDFDVGQARLQILQPKSVGYIRLQSAFYKDPPFINANYFAHPNDMETLLRGIKRQLKFATTKSFKKHKGKFIRQSLPECDKFKYKSDAYWQCFIHYMSTADSHAVGTCKMAPKSKSGVVDDELRVYGVTNLRVADASIMPYVPSSNTNAAVLMIGEKAAAMIKKAQSGKS